MGEPAGQLARPTDAAIDQLPANEVPAAAPSLRLAGRALARWPRRLWLIIALQALLMLAVTILYPAFQNPDEQAHVDYVLAHRDGQWLDGPGQRFYQTGVVVAAKQVPVTQFRIHVGDIPPLPRDERKSFDALGTAPARTYQPNQMVQHPPLYYGLAAGFTYLLPDFSARSFEVQVFWMRLFSILLMLPVPLLIYGAARRVSRSVNVALIAATLPLSVPSYLRTGAAVNNDSLLVVLTVGLLALLARVAWGDLSRRTAVWAGVLWGADLLTKGFALSLPIVIVACYLVGARGSIIARIREVWRPVLICGGIGSAIGAWWWVRNLIVYKVVQPDGFGPFAAQIDRATFSTHTKHGTNLGFVRAFLKLLGQRTWGSLGLIDTPSLPLSLLWALVIGSVVLIAVSVARRDPHSGWGPVRASVLVLPLILTLGIMAFGAHTAYLRGSVLPGVQARYIVPDFAGLAICIGVSLCWLAGRYQRWLPPLVLTGTVLFIAASALRVLDIEMSPTEPSRVHRLGDALKWVAAWAPWRASVSTVIIGLTVVVAVLAVVAFWAAAITTEPALVGAPVLDRDDPS